MASEVNVKASATTDEKTTPSPVASGELPSALVKAITKEVKRELGKHEVNYANSGIRSVFVHTPGALVCKNCTALNLADATVCVSCGMSYEISLFVGPLE